MRAESLRIRNKTFVHAGLRRRSAKYCKREEFQRTMALTLCDHSELFLHTLSCNPAKLDPLPASHWNGFPLMSLREWHAQASDDSG
jgi:hypothetical protein